MGTAYEQQDFARPTETREFPNGQARPAARSVAPRSAG